MSDVASRHPWDPRSALAPAERDGEFLHLLGCTERVQMRQEEVLARARRGNYTYRGPGAIQQLAKAVGWSVGLLFVWVFSVELLRQLGAAMFGLDVTLPSANLHKFGTVGRVVDGCSILGGLLVPRQLWLWAARNKPTLTGKWRHIADQLATLESCRFSPELLVLVEQAQAEPRGLETRLDDERAHGLRDSLNRLTVCRWDLLTELRTRDSTLPEATLEAFDTAAVPLMAFALTLDEVSTVATESRHEALARLDGQVSALVDKIDRVRDEQASRRKAARLAAQSGVAEVEGEAISQMTDLTDQGFDAGMSQLDALIESDRELED